MIMITDDKFSEQNYFKVRLSAFLPTCLNLELSTTVPQVVAMSDIMAGTTLEDLEYSDEEDEMESDEGDIDKVGALLG